MFIKYHKQESKAPGLFVEKVGEIATHMKMVYSTAVFFLHNYSLFTGIRFIRDDTKYSETLCIGMQWVFVQCLLRGQKYNETLHVIR